MSTPPITLVLVDDHPIVLNGLQQLFADEPDFKILASCADGEASLDAVRRQRPDILVLDLQMPRKSGLTVLRELHEERLPTRVVVLTASLDSQDVLRAVRLGARGIVLKNMAPTLLVQCLRSVQAGEHWLERCVITQAPDHLRQRDSAADCAADQLTPRELEIVRLAARGLRNKEISARLDITEGTVKMHLHNIYQKLEVDSRIELALHAQQKHLL